MREEAANAEPLTAEEQLQANYQMIADLVEHSLIVMRAINPTVQPMPAAQEMIRHICASMDALVPSMAVNQGLLIVFEGRHAKPMSFIDIGKAKAALVAIVAARRQVEGLPSLIIPGGVE